MALLRSSRSPFIALAVVVAAAGLAASCAGSEETLDDDDGTSTTSTGGAGGQGGQGAAGGAGAQGGGGTGGAGGQGGQGGMGGMPMSMCADPNASVFSASKIFFGDTDTNDVSSAQAWKQFGHDVDGVVTTNDFTGHCTPNSGGNTTAQVDGDNGIDNSFGRNVLPLVLAFDPTFSTTANANLLAGEYTLLLKLTGLGVAPDQDPVPTKFYGAAPLGMPPAFNGTDCWSVQPEQLTDPTDIETAKVSFPDAALASSIWSSGVADDSPISISFSGFSLTLNLKSARLTMTFDPTNTSAVDGQLGGVIETEQFVDEFKKAAGSFDPSLCMGATIDSISTQVRQASDMMQDGTQNPNAVCNGISIGLGFRMELAGIAGIAPASPPPYRSLRAVTESGPISSLQRAGEALSRGDDTSALLASIEAWRERRAVEIASIVHSLSARFERLRAAPVDKTQRGRLVKWVDVARRMDPTDLAMLLATFEVESGHGHADLVVPRLDELEKRADDPRPVPYLLRALAEPKVFGTRSRKVFTRIFRCLVAAGDPASILPLQTALDTAIRREPQQYDTYILRERGPKTVATLAARFPLGAPILADEERAAVERLASEIAKLPAPSLEAAPTAAPRKAEAETELLAAVYRDPDDDGPRLVYADWLEQQGDSRGELIVLQIERAHGRSTPKALRREKALIKQHQGALLGPLAAVVRKPTAVFERGFVAECEAQIKKPAQAETELSHEAWGTVRKILFSGGHTRITRAMTALCEVDGVCDFGLRGLAEAPRPRLRGLGFHLRDDAMPRGEPRSPGLRALASATTLPSLARLSIHGSAREYAGGFRYRGPSDWRWVLSAPFAPSLEELGVDQHLEQERIVADWIAELAAHASGVRRLELRDGYRVRLERSDDATTWCATLRMQRFNTEYVTYFVRRTQRGFERAPIARIVIESPVDLSDGDLAIVDAAAKPLRAWCADVSIAVVSTGRSG